MPAGRLRRHSVASHDLRVRPDGRTGIEPACGLPAILSTMMSVSVVASAVDDDDLVESRAVWSVEGRLNDAEASLRVGMITANVTVAR